MNIEQLRAAADRNPDAVMLVLHPEDWAELGFPACIRRSDGSTVYVVGEGLFRGAIYLRYGIFYHV